MGVWSSGPVALSVGKEPPLLFEQARLGRRSGLDVSSGLDVLNKERDRISGSCPKSNSDCAGHSIPYDRNGITMYDTVISNEA